MRPWCVQPAAYGATVGRLTAALEASTQALQAEYRELRQARALAPQVGACAPHPQRSPNPRLCPRCSRRPRCDQWHGSAVISATPPRVRQSACTTKATAAGSISRCWCDPQMPRPATQGPRVRCGLRAITGRLSPPSPFSACSICRAISSPQRVARSNGRGSGARVATRRARL